MLETPLTRIQAAGVGLSVDRQVGANVRAEMSRAGVTQAVAAGVTQLTQASLSDRLRGQIPFRIAELVLLARHLEVPFDRFLTGLELPQG